MKKYLILLLTLFYVASASAQTVPDTIPVIIKVPGIGKVDLSNYYKKTSTDSITTVLRSEIQVAANGGITKAQLDSAANLKLNITDANTIFDSKADTGDVVKKGSYFPIGLVSPLIPKDSFNIKLDSLRLPPLRYLGSTREINTDTSLTDVLFVKNYVDSSIETVSGAGGSTDTTSLSNRINALNNRTLEGKQIYTGTSSVTVTDSTITWLIINPSSTTSAITITTPSVPKDRQKIEISFGGTVTTGTVVTSLTITPNIGQGILGDTVFMNVEVRDKIVLRYNSSNSKWYQ